VLALLTRRGELLTRLQLRLGAESPQRQLAERQLRQESLQLRLQHAWSSQLARASSRVQVAARALQSVSPLATLGRGFSILTRAQEGTLVTDAGQIQVGDELEARLAVGALRARVIAKQET
jgi:exodeoxyribonuclease VII large subunit